MKASGTADHIFAPFCESKNDSVIDIKFDSHVDLVKIDVDALEKKLADMVELLNGGYPGHNSECKTCSYHDGRAEI